MDSGISRPLPVLDRRSRPIRDLRVSVTDRCNFRCPYCMPRAAFQSGRRFLPRAEILNFEEITRLARVFAGLGVQKIRLTGGEPLLRSQLPKLVSALSEIPRLDLALTTNGSLLAAQAAALAAAGLRRITVSLDTLDPDVFRTMSDTDVPVAEVLRGIDAALGSGLSPVKVNAVVRRGVNEDGVVRLARHFKGTGVILRFIEFMDVGTTNGWRSSDVVPAREIVERLSRELPLVPVAPEYSGEVAKRFRYADGSGEIGVIASVTEPFCGACTRGRLSANGHFYTCLFATQGLDLRPVLRSGENDEALEALLGSTWRARDDRYSELRALQRERPKLEMSYLGG